MTDESSNPPAMSAETPQLPSSDERTMAMLCHLSGIVLCTLGYLGFLGPLVVWLIKKDQSAYIDHHGKEALNFQLTMFLILAAGSIVAFILTFIVVGIFLFLLLGVVALVALVIEVVACVAAYRGEWYRYPFCIRFIS